MTPTLLTGSKDHMAYLVGALFSQMVDCSMGSSLMSISLLGAPLLFCGPMGGTWLWRLVLLRAGFPPFKALSFGLCVWLSFMSLSLSRCSQTVILCVST